MEGKVRSVPVSIRFLEDERRLIDNAARLDGSTHPDGTPAISHWCRSVLIAAARERAAAQAPAG